jgi:thiol:disulfide interchange protein DsbA
MLRSLLVLFAVLLAPALIAPAAAQQAGVRPNLEYREIRPQPVLTGDKIEVVEFFWYGCPHCNALQGPIEAWLKKKPADVEWRYIPAVFRQSWMAHARLYYTLEALGEIPRLHQAVYRAIHVEKEDVSTAESSAAWASRHGVDRSKWLAAYNAPDMDAKIQQAVAATRNYEIEGTPSIVVDGRYRTSTSMSDSYQGVMTITDELVRMARERRSASK